MDVVSKGVPTGRYDVVVVGGGAAGLSGALALSRARRTVLVIDGGEPRNAPAHGVHNYLGRDGIAPAQLLADGRAEVVGYGGQVVAGQVVGARRLDGPLEGAPGGFALELADGETVQARRVLVATGLVDELPAVPGLAERWGRDVLHCPYCHGWEVQGQRIAVLGTSAAAVHIALLWRQWSERVTLLQHTTGPLSAEQSEQLAARGVAVAPGEVTGLVVHDDRLAGVRVQDGRTVECQALVIGTQLTARIGALAGLGLQTEQVSMGELVLGSRIPIGPAGATAVPGVWVAGNAADVMAQVVGSAAAGLAASAAINADLIAQDTAQAVTAYRTRPQSATAAGRAASPVEVFSAQSERELCEQVLGDRRHGL